MGTQTCSGDRAESTGGRAAEEAEERIELRAGSGRTGRTVEDGRALMRL